MTLKQLPCRPPPVRDELLSSWIGRLARANPCSIEELYGYLNLGQGSVPERASDLGHVNWARLCAALQQTRDEIAAMTLPDTTHLLIHYVSSDDFQICVSCVHQTPGLILRHWRFAWSLTCETCGQALVAKHPRDGIPDKLRIRAARGADTLRQVIKANDLRRIRRIARTLSVLQMFGLSYSAPLTSRCQLKRSTALAAVNVCATRPLLGAAILMRGNDGAFWELRRVFPQHRRVIARVRRLAQDLDLSLPRQPKAEPAPKQKTQRLNRPTASEGALQAARQAISELGPDADRQALLARADAIWKRRSCVEH